MPTHLERIFPSGKMVPFVDLIPGLKIHVYTENEKRQLNRALLVSCLITDEVTEIYDYPNPEGVIDPTDPVSLESSIDDSHRIDSLKYGEVALLPMFDYEEGPFGLIV